MDELKCKIIKNLFFGRKETKINECLLLTSIKHGIGNFVVCCFPYSSTWCQVEIGGDWLKDYLIILEIWIDFYRIIHSSTSKGLYNFFNIQSFWVNQIPNYLFFYSFFGTKFIKKIKFFLLLVKKKLLLVLISYVIL